MAAAAAALPESCLYVTIGSQSIAWTHLLPWFVTLSLSALALNTDHHGYWKKNFFLVAYGLYLHFWQYALWVFQNLFAVPRPLVDCSHIYTFSSPSQEGFYIAALASLFVMYSFVWRVDISSSYWAFIWIFLVAPPAVLVWFGYALWWEVLFGMGAGILATAAYVTVFRVYLLDSVPYLLHQVPWTWMSCNEQWCLTDAERAFGDTIPRCIARCERVIAARAAHRGPLHFSWPWARSLW